MQDTTTIKFSTTGDLQKQPVEFNILGSISSNGNNQWTASGRYINDDGLTLDLTNNVNAYTLYTSFDGTSTISFRVGMDLVASNFMQADKCMAVNKNDYLSSLSFHNAKAFGVNADFTVSVVQKQGTYSGSVTASYDAVNDRLHMVVAAGSEVCLSNLLTIKLTKK